MCFRRDKTGKTVWSTASRIIGVAGNQNEKVWVLCQNVPVLVSAQNLRPAQDAEALAHAVLQGEAILPESLIQGQQQFEDLRDVPGEDIAEDIRKNETSIRKDKYGKDAAEDAQGPLGNCVSALYGMVPAPGSCRGKFVSP